MIVLSWNCRGIGHPATVPALCELVRARRPDIVFLFETIVVAARLEVVRIKLKFDYCFAVDCIGYSGGLCVFWNKKASCQVVNYSQNHIDLHIVDDRFTWRLTRFYGIPQRNRRRSSWNLLRSLAKMSILPWLTIGDFNDLLCESDKRGRVQHPRWLFRGFRETMEDCGLSDVFLNGHKFTWSRGGGLILK
ncbi:hypothetical protein ACS0TY_010225 [Phlomoides rotata]